MAALAAGTATSSSATVPKNSLDPAACVSTHFTLPPATYTVLQKSITAFSTSVTEAPLAWREKRTTPAFVRKLIKAASANVLCLFVPSGDVRGWRGLLIECRVRRISATTEAAVE